MFHSLSAISSEQSSSASHAVTLSRASPDYSKRFIQTSFNLKHLLHASIKRANVGNKAHLYLDQPARPIIR